MNKQNSIEINTVIFAAGESRLFALSGEYFEVIEAPNPIDVTLSEITGAQRARMNQASASFYSKGVEFGIIQITSATAQTIRFAYGSGETGTRRYTGSVTVSGAIALDAATLLSLEQTNVRPEASTGNYKSQAAIAANTADTVFTAGANTNGAILLTASMGSREVANARSSFLAKATAPTGFLDGEPFLVSKMIVADAAANTFGADIQTQQFIPAGLGLFYISDVALTLNAVNHRACRYRLL